MCWFTNSYRKIRGEVPERMREKAKFPRVDYCYSRVSVRRGHTVHSAVAKD